MNDQQRKDAALAAIQTLVEIRRADSNALLAHPAIGTTAGDSDAAFIRLASEILALAK